MPSRRPPRGGEVGLDLLLLGSYPYRLLTCRFQRGGALVEFLVPEAELHSELGHSIL
jgi:hypothetical protein